MNDDKPLIDGPITSIKAIPWWQLAHAARLLLAGWQFYGPHKGSIVFVRVGESMPIYGMPASTDDTHTGDDARPPYNAEAVRQALNPDDWAAHVESSLDAVTAGDREAINSQIPEFKR